MGQAPDAAERLAAIVSSSDDAIISKDLNGVIQSWNRGAERIFGYTADEAVGKSITIIIPEERLDEEKEVLRRIRAGQMVDHFETVRRAKDGHSVDISLTVSPIRDDEGRIIGASKIARDITEARRLRQEAEEADRLKDEFLATLSHELRTPLNAVVGYTNMLRSGVIPESQRDKALDVIQRNIDSLTQLVNDLLDVSTIVSGKVRLRLQPCELRTVVEEAIEVIMPAAEAKGVAIAPNLGSNDPVSGDHDRLRQVLWNLLTNAVKFTPPGGHVYVGLERAGRLVRVVVRDTGVGLAPESLPYLFQRFWQAETGKMRAFGGLGLGLALSRHFVELHGGRISARSEGLGKGAEFTVELPALIRAAAEQSEALA
ncbi:MAG: hypothetical protein A3H96_07905 [Acidobacteria bacterium RIFCSPLOWO2_02_FULL_67_36]|nr:MAG: hypothetical protein A3H96_07905 [Acidobacteria bacterium RIFCSPLOWO2_02_FULL_67_36]OFW20142.1 MAG: hypothetical protein A3G21_03870 [Acidobacteria bacterium RIFCSPLOWO2_12_FULL_66_21]